MGVEHLVHTMQRKMEEGGDFEEHIMAMRNLWKEARDMGAANRAGQGHQSTGHESTGPELRSTSRDLLELRTQVAYKREMLGQGWWARLVSSQVTFLSEGEVRRSRIKSQVSRVEGQVSKVECQRSSVEGQVSKWAFTGKVVCTLGLYTGICLVASIWTELLWEWLRVSCESLWLFICYDSGGVCWAWSGAVVWMHSSTCFMELSIEMFEWVGKVMKGELGREGRLCGLEGKAPEGWRYPKGMDPTTKVNASNSNQTTNTLAVISSPADTYALSAETGVLSTLSPIVPPPDAYDPRHELLHPSVLEEVYGKHQSESWMMSSDEIDRSLKPVPKTHCNLCMNQTTVASMSLLCSLLDSGASDHCWRERGSFSLYQTVNGKGQTAQAGEAGEFPIPGIGEVPLWSKDGSHQIRLLNIGIPWGVGEQTNHYPQPEWSGDGHVSNTERENALTRKRKQRRKHLSSTRVSLSNVSCPIRLLRMAWLSKRIRQ
ncbi:hypothetical protein PM082_019290 [Marasmius tenuissimus]|nr:hypothetical protein PM082_019290 [Marasmius tenuissimus]